MKNPEIIQVVERNDFEETSTFEYILPDEAKQVPELPKQLVEFINLGICLNEIYIYIYTPAKIR